MGGQWTLWTQIACPQVPKSLSFAALWLLHIHPIPLSLSKPAPLFLPPVLHLRFWGRGPPSRPHCPLWRSGGSHHPPELPPVSKTQCPPGTGRACFLALFLSPVPGICQDLSFLLPLCPARIFWGVGAFLLILFVVKGDLVPNGKPSDAGTCLQRPHGPAPGPHNYLLTSYWGMHYFYWNCIWTIMRKYSSLLFKTCQVHE